MGLVQLAVLGELKKKKLYNYKLLKHSSHGSRKKKKRSNFQERIPVVVILDLTAELNSVRLYCSTLELVVLDV